jgi:queuine/archaeosine tRNA-ribosyltransferase
MEKIMSDNKITEFINLLEADILDITDTHPHRILNEKEMRTIADRTLKRIEDFRKDNKYV